MATNDPVEVQVTPLDESRGAVFHPSEISAVAGLARITPRNEEAAANRALSTLERHPDLAEAATYSFERGGKPIKGVGVKGARLLQKEWRNNLVARTVQDDGAGNRKARGIFLDVENGIIRISDRMVPKGEKRKGTWHVYSADEYEMSTLREMSKAERDAILASIPDFLTAQFHDKCFEMQTAAAMKQGPTDRRWEKAKDRLKQLNVKPETALRYMRLGSEKELTHRSLTTLAQGLQAIAQGEATVETVFGDYVVEDAPQKPQAATMPSGATIEEKVVELPQVAVELPGAREARAAVAPPDYPRPNSPADIGGEKGYVKTEAPGKPTFDFG